MAKVSENVQLEAAMAGAFLYVNYIVMSDWESI